MTNNEKFETNRPLTRMYVTTYFFTRGSVNLCERKESIENKDDDDGSFFKPIR